MSRASIDELEQVAITERMRTASGRSPPVGQGCRARRRPETRCHATGADPWAPERNSCKVWPDAKKVLRGHIRGGLVAGVGCGGISGSAVVKAITHLGVEALDVVKQRLRKPIGDAGGTPPWWPEASTALGEGIRQPGRKASVGNPTSSTGASWMSGPAWTGVGLPFIQRRSRPTSGAL